MAQNNREQRLMSVGNVVLVGRMYSINGFLLTASAWYA